MQALETDTFREGQDMPEFLLQELSRCRSEDEVRSIREGWRAACSRPVTLRANSLKATADEVSGALGVAGIGFERVPWYPDAFVLEGVRERAVWDLPVYRDGKVYLQSLSSMLPPLALHPRAGADVLDACAAPGGKTSQIAALTAGTAHITACELNGPRADKLVHNLDKLGVGNVNVMRTDARRLDVFFSFDQVLVDAPCTGSGTVRAGDPRAGQRITAKLLDKTRRQQAALLDRALDVLKPGGNLVYSTCSLLPDENEAQVEKALARHGDCKVVPVGKLGGIDLEDPPFHALEPRLDGTLTICPDRFYEGFFIACIEKVR